MITNEITNKITNLQDKIIRTISKNKNKKEINKEYKNLYILKMGDIIEYEANKFMYKIKNKALPNTVMELFEDTTAQTTRETRNAGIPRVANHKTKIYNSSILAYANRTWRALPQVIKNSKSIAIFKKEFKKYKISNY